MPREDAAHLGRRPVPVVGHRRDDHRHARGADPLVGDLLELLGIGSPTGGSLDRALDVVGRHRVGASLVDGHPQSVVRIGVSAALAGGGDDLAGQLREERPALRVVGALLPLDLGPLAVAGHGISWAGYGEILALPSPNEVALNEERRGAGDDQARDVHAKEDEGAAAVSMPTVRGRDGRGSSGPSFDSVPSHAAEPAGAVAPSGDGGVAPRSPAWYPASSRRSSSRCGNLKKTSVAPSKTATMPAR